MNNNVYFKITVPGANLDDKRFYEYGDVATTYPTYEQSLTKANAFIKMDELKKALTTVDTLTHFEIKYTTAGTATSVPVAAIITVGYKSLENLVRSVYNTGAITPTTTKTQIEAMAVAVLKSFVDEVFANQYSVGAIVSKPVTRNNHSGVSQVYNQPAYEVVTTAAATPTTAVAIVNLTA